MQGRMHLKRMENPSWYLHTDPPGERDLSDCAPGSSDMVPEPDGDMAPGRCVVRTESTPSKLGAPGMEEERLVVQVPPPGFEVECVVVRGVPGTTSKAGSAIFQSVPLTPPRLAQEQEVVMDTPMMFIRL